MSEKQSTKDKIIDVAIDLFSQRGFSDVSIREITKEVGIKESSLYNHFTNKDDLLQKILTSFRIEFTKVLPTEEQLDAILATTSLERVLTRGFERFQEHLSIPRNERCWRILSNEQYRLPAARDIYLVDIIGKTLQFLENVFSKAIELGKINNSYKPDLLASEYQYAMFAMLSEYNLLRFDGKETTAIVEKMQKHIKFFLKIVKM